MFRTMHRSMSFRQPFLYKILLILIFVVLIIISLSLWSTDNGAIGHKCFSLNDESLLTTYQDIIFLDDITYSVKKPTPGRSIFFHETSCARDGLITLNARYVSWVSKCRIVSFTWLQSIYDFSGRRAQSNQLPKSTPAGMYFSYSRHQSDLLITPKNDSHWSKRCRPIPIFICETLICGRTLRIHQSANGYLTASCFYRSTWIRIHRISCGISVCTNTVAHTWI